MFQMLTAYTLEADDAEYALGEILKQLQPEKNLLAYSAGLLFCHPDFMESGVAQKIAEALPFEVIGGTLAATMVTGMDDSLMLALTVFTSDNVQFATMHAEEMRAEAFQQSYLQATDGGKKKPSMILPLFPLPTPVGVDTVLEAYDRLSGGAPVFGSIVMDYTTDYSRCYTLRNGERFRGGLVSLLFFGPVKPVFYVATMSEKYVQKEKAIITQAEGTLMKEVNGVTFQQYAKTLGLSRAMDTDGVGSIPFLINFNDGTRSVARVIHFVTPEGYARCSGMIPENGTLAVGSVESADILRMTEEAMKAVREIPDKKGMVAFPCVSHYLVMGFDANEQKEIIRKLMPEGLPCQLGYVAGEICPVYGEAGKLHNRFHNFTCTVCVFQET